MSEFNWLHFSDLHFSAKDGFDTKTARRQLLECLKRIGEGKTYDYIFITGDVANRCDYTGAKEFLEKLISCINLPPDTSERIFWAVGNHDISRTRKIRNQIIEEIRTSKESHSEFQKSMADDETRPILTKTGMKEYSDNYKGLTGHTLSDSDIDSAHRVISNDDLNIVVLNTCLTSCDGNDKGNLFITEPKLFELFQALDPHKPVFVLGHHGSEFFRREEDMRLAHLFDDNSVDFYLCGHEHRLGYRTFSDAKRDIHQLTCGGGIFDGYSKFTFMSGEYKDGIVKITPYSYSENGNSDWNTDFTLHRRLKEDTSFKIDRLISKNPDTAHTDSAISNPPTSSASELYFEGSQRYYDRLTDVDGRFGYIKYDSDLFPKVELDTQVTSAEKPEPIDIIECITNEKHHCLFIGEGGMGKTTSLLKIWNVRLNDKKHVPLYIPLNEFNINETSGFISSYVKDYYSLSLEQLSQKVVLLLDGFNEITKNSEPILNEIRRLSLKSNILLVMTSRYDFIKTYGLQGFVAYDLLPLSDEKINSFLTNNNLPSSNIPTNVLETPMMLSLYANTCLIQNRSAGLKVLKFKENNTKGELIYNFLLCQIAKLLLDNETKDVITTYVTLFHVAPYVAHEIEKDGQFFFEKNRLSELIADCLEIYGNHLIECAKNELKDLIKKYNLHGQIEQYTPNAFIIESLLIYKYHVFIDEDNRYTFRHQHIRDFLSALHIVNAIEFHMKNGVIANEIKDRVLFPYVSSMIGDYLGDYKNKDKYSEKTILHRLIDSLLREKESKTTGFALNNVFEIWKIARENKIIGEDLSRLDFSNVLLNGVIFSSYEASTSFEGATMMYNTIMPLGHWGSISFATYSTDNRFILSASSDGTIKEWDRLTHLCVATFWGHSDSVNSAVYSKDCKFILSSSNDGTVKEWDRSAHSCVATFRGSNCAANCSVYSEDGSFILSSFEDGTIMEWDRQTGNCIAKYSGHRQSVTGVIYSLDNRCILSASDDGNIKEWDRQSHHCTATYNHGEPVESAVYSNDGRFILSCSLSGTIKEWERGTHRCIDTYTDIDVMCGAIYSRDDKFILSCSWPGIVKERNRYDKTTANTYEGHYNRANGAVYSNDELFILLFYSDGTFTEFDRKTQNCIANYSCNYSDLFCTTYSGYDRLILSCTIGGEIKEWDRHTGYLTWTHWFNSKGAISAIYSKDGKFILSCLNNSSIIELDRQTHKIVAVYAGHDDSVSSAVYSNDDKYILSASHDNTIKEWDRQTHKCIATYSIPSSELVRSFSSAIYSSDGQFVLSASWDGTIKEWDRQTNLCVYNYATDKNDGASVNGAVYSNDGRFILSYFTNNTMVEWDRQTHICTATYYGHDSPINSAVYSSDDAFILSASEDRTIKEWDRQTCSCVATYSGHQGGVSSAVYSSDGKYILSSSEDGTIKEWERETQKCVRTITNYQGIYVMGCNFKNVRFDNDEVKRIVHHYGGIVFDTFLTGVQIKSLRHLRSLDITLDSTVSKHLIITGINGSGKTCLLNCIHERVRAIIENRSIEDNEELELSFKDSDSEDFSEDFQKYISEGLYTIEYFKAGLLNEFNAYDEGFNSAESSKDFFSYMTYLKNITVHSEKEGNLSLVAQNQAWFREIDNLLKEIFDDPSTSLEYDYRKPPCYITQKTKEDGAEKTIHFNHLPHGYSSVLHIISKLLYDKEHAHFNAFKRYGLVLIDEIETHLHVNMQKKVLPCLIKFFPNIQFIVATHSPFVLNSVDNAIVCDLELQETTVTYMNGGVQGWTVDEVLTKLMNVKDTNSLKASKLMDEYDSALNNNDYEGAKNAFGKLKVILHPNNPLQTIMQLQMIGMRDVQDDKD